MSSAMEKTLFNMKMTAKMLEREANKKEKEKKEYDKRAMQSMDKSIEKTKMFAAEAIRCQNISLQFTRLALRMEAVSSRVESAIRMKTFTKQLGSVVTDMNGVLESMDPERIGKMMDKFEKQFENLDVGTATMEESIDRTTATSMPDSEVENYLEQLKTLHAMDQTNQIRSMGSVPTGNPLGSMNASSSSSTNPQRIADPVGGMAGPPNPNNQNNNNNNNQNNQNNGGGGGNVPASNSSSNGGGGNDIADVLAARLAALKR